MQKLRGSGDPGRLHRDLISVDGPCCRAVASQRDFLNQKKTARPDISGLAVLSDFPLVDSNASVKQVAAVVVSVAEGNTEQPRSRRGAVGSEDGKRYGQAIVGPRSDKGNGMRNFVKSRRSARSSQALETPRFSNGRVHNL